MGQPVNQIKLLGVSQLSWHPYARVPPSNWLMMGIILTGAPYRTSTFQRSVWSTELYTFRGR